MARIVVCVVLLLLVGVISVSARELISYSVSDVRKVVATDVLFGEDKPFESDFFSEYEKAEKHKNDIQEELNSHRRMRDAIWYVLFHASDATASLQEGEKVWDKRHEALNLLLKKRTTALERRDMALVAVDAYRSAAVDALKAIAIYAGADQGSAEEQARNADAAIVKKVKLKLMAKNAVTEAETAYNDYFHLSEDILRYDDELMRLLSGAQKSSIDIQGLCDSLAIKLDKDKKSNLVSLVGSFLAEVQPKINRFVRHVTEAASLGVEEELNKIVDDDSAGIVAVRAYFVASVYASVTNESHTFLFMAQSESVATKEAQAEIGVASLSVKRAWAKADTERKRAETRITAVQKDQNALSAKLEIISYSERVLTHLVGESLVLVDGIDPVKELIKQCVDEKEQEYIAACFKVNKYKKYFEPIEYIKPKKKALYFTKFEENHAYNEMSEAIHVLDHVYIKVEALSDEPKNYGAYTYVLFRQNYATAQTHIKKRYIALLDALYRSTTSSKKFTGLTHTEKLNLFCIPYKNGEYDADLARSYLATAGSGAILRKEIISRLRNSPGPFLLTTRIRLSEGSYNNQLLFVDLSRYPVNAFDSILAAYKKTLVEQPPTGQEIWNPPATQRVIYIGISASDAIPSLLESIKGIIKFFVTTTNAVSNK